MCTLSKFQWYLSRNNEIIFTIQFWQTAGIQCCNVVAMILQRYRVRSVRIIIETILVQQRSRLATLTSLVYYVRITTWPWTVVNWNNIYHVVQRLPPVVHGHKYLQGINLDINGPLNILSVSLNYYISMPM